MGALDFSVGEYVIYINGDSIELGKIKRLTSTGAYVYYSEGGTAAKTPYECLHKLIKKYTIKETTLGKGDTYGGDYW